jgi:hypothetical protein
LVLGVVLGICGRDGATRDRGVKARDLIDTNAHEIEIGLMGDRCAIGAKSLLGGSFGFFGFGLGQWFAWGWSR